MNNSVVYFYLQILIFLHYSVRVCICVYCSIWGSTNIAAFNVIVFLMIAAHLRAVFSDPGAVPLPKTSLDFSDMHSGQKMSKVFLFVLILDFSFDSFP